MAGLGYKDFTAGAVLTAAQVDGYLMEQAVMNFAGTAARGSALSSVQSAGMMAHVGGGTVTVYDGSAWQQVYPAQAGLVFVAGTAFSAVSSVNVNNCFTSTYTNYQILVNITAASTNVVVALRLRVSGSDASGASDYRNIFVGNSSTNADQRNTSANSWFLIGQSATGGPSMTTCTVFRPNEAASTQVISSNFGSTGSTFYGLFYSSQHSLATAYDGVTLLPDTGTFTGSLRVFGYRNS